MTVSEATCEAMSSRALASRSAASLKSRSTGLPSWRVRPNACLEADQRGGVGAPETVLAWRVVERDAVSVTGQFGDGVVDREASRVALRERVERTNELHLEVVLADPRERLLVRFRAALEACCLERGDHAIDVFGACAGVDVAGGAERDVASVQRDAYGARPDDDDVVADGREGVGGEAQQSVGRDDLHVGMMRRRMASARSIARSPA